MWHMLCMLRPTTGAATLAGHMRTALHTISAVTAGYMCVFAMLVNCSGDSASSWSGLRSCAVQTRPTSWTAPLHAAAARLWQPAARLMVTVMDQVAVRAAV